MLSAIALGAQYAAPYLGRMFDGGQNGIEDVITMGQIVNKVKSPMRLLVASIRQSDHLVTLAKHGLNTFTILPRIIDELLENDLTTLAIESFEAEVSE